MILPSHPTLNSLTTPPQLRNRYDCFIDYIDSDKHGLTAGFGLRLSVLQSIFPQPLELDAFFSLVFMARRTTHKDDPADPIGDYVSRGLWYGGGVTTKFLF